MVNMKGKVQRIDTLKTKSGDTVFRVTINDTIVSGFRLNGAKVGDEVELSYNEVGQYKNITGITVIQQFPVQTKLTDTGSAPKKLFSDKEIAIYFSLCMKIAGKNPNNLSMNDVIIDAEALYELFVTKVQKLVEKNQ